MALVTNYDMAVTISPDWKKCKTVEEVLHDALPSELLISQINPDLSEDDE